MQHPSYASFICPVKSLRKQKDVSDKQSQSNGTGTLLFGEEKSAPRAWNWQMLLHYHRLKEYQAQDNNQDPG